MTASNTCVIHVKLLDVIVCCCVRMCQLCTGEDRAGHLLCFNHVSCVRDHHMHFMQDHTERREMIDVLSCSHDTIIIPCSGMASCHMPMGCLTRHVRHTPCMHFTCYHFVCTRRRMPRSPHRALDYATYRHATIEICTCARSDVLLASSHTHTHLVHMLID